MKTYIKPKATLVVFNATQVLLQNSLPVGETPVDGNNALARPSGLFDSFEGNEDANVIDDIFQ